MYKTRFIYDKKYSLFIIIIIVIVIQIESAGMDLGQDKTRRS